VNILIAPDKFKGSLSASEVCNAVSDALLELNPSLRITKVPLADGGEGTFEILVDQSKGRIKKVVVLDPLQRPIEAEYGLSEDGTIAFIEMAKASGLQLLREGERNPLYTTTIGTGQLIKDALDEGVTNIILGIGGSATNDAGIGMAHALGYRFLDRENSNLIPVGKSLSMIHNIDKSGVDVRLQTIAFTVLCDVTNPLFGPQGAASVYGPQKGATALMVEELDTGLKHLADLVNNAYAYDLNFPGAGAAGGLGAGAKLFLHATLKKGIDYICQITDLEEKIKNCELVITGEGKVDQQSLSGKVVAHVYAMAKKYQKRVFILCGQCTLSPNERLAFGSDKIIPLANNPSEVNLAMEQTTKLIRSTIKRTLNDL
jgi:glycerate kinase